MKKKLEQYRQTMGPWKTRPGDDHGLFYIPSPTCNNMRLKVICGPMNSDWQHVSVSLPKRCPNWLEMAKIKELFWDEDETVAQFHPKKSEYVDNHPNVLHLWKKKDEDFELPPSILTGIKELDPEILKKVLEVKGISEKVGA